jgi:hypothetical protein
VWKANAAIDGSHDCSSREHEATAAGEDARNQDAGRLTAAAGRDSARATWLHPGPGTAAEIDIREADHRKEVARFFWAVEKPGLIHADESLGVGQVLPGFVLRFSHVLDRGPIAPISLD